TKACWNDLGKLRSWDFDSRSSQEQFSASPRLCGKSFCKSFRVENPAHWASNTSDLCSYFLLSPPRMRDRSVPTPLKIPRKTLLCCGAEDPRSHCWSASRSLTVSVCTSTVRS